LSSKQKLLLKTNKAKMIARFKMGRVQPAAYKAMDALDTYVSNTGIDDRQQELIRIRASQINGCAYCVNQHSKDARKAGETEEKVFLISAWREAENVFNEEERLLFTITEEITLIHQHGLSDATYEKAIALFGEEKTAKIIMTIITINAWNRIGVGLKMQPEL
jgi:AhpD family alkylhydroperoxidase